MLATNTVIVFKEHHIDGQPYFQWFRVGDREQDEDHIMPEDMLTEEEHWQRFRNVCS